MAEPDKQRNHCTVEHPVVTNLSGQTKLRADHQLFDPHRKQLNISQDLEKQRVIGQKTSCCLLSEDLVGGEGLLIRSCSRRRIVKALIYLAAKITFQSDTNETQLISLTRW